jgi:leucyl-tRNA synthetase
MALPIVSTAGFEGESELRRFRRLSVADVLARHASQLLGRPAVLMEVAAPDADEGPGRPTAAASAALDRLPRTRLAISGGKLVLKCEDLLGDLLESKAAANWPESVLAAQRVAVGGSRGAFARFARADGRGDIEVFTTRPDTIFGASFVAVSASHPVARLASPEQLATFQAECERVADDPSAKVGIPLGLSIHNPFQPERLLPVWLANFVVDTYGTGAAGGCPACDQRDLDFARHYGIDVLSIVCPPGMDPDTYQVGEAAHSGDGTIINSGFLSGLPVAAAIEAAIERLAQTGLGRPAVQYRRPAITVADPVPDGEGDVLFADRPWRFTSPFLAAAAIVVPAAGTQWRPHVLHVTAPETAARHLLDARVLLRALGDGHEASNSEPCEEVVLIGDVLGSSRTPPVAGTAATDDAFRLAVLADTPPERELEWSDGRPAATLKFVEGASRLFITGEGRQTDRASLIQDIAKPAVRLEEALRRRRLNAAVAAAREITGLAGARAAVAPLDDPAQELIASLLYSLLPGVCRDAGSSAGTAAAWPDDLRDAGAGEMIDLPVQINGKKRGTVQVTPDAGEEAVLAAIHENSALSTQLGDKVIRKLIVVPNRLVSIVI